MAALKIAMRHANPHPTPHPAPHVAAWQKRSVYAIGALLLLTGLPWLALHYTAGAGAGGLPHPLQAWLMRLHGLGAMAGVFVLGAVAAAHVPTAWHASRRRRRVHQRHTGIGLCTLAAMLALSGYGLYYFAPEWLRPTLGWSHTIVGVAMAGTLAWHRRGARRSRAGSVNRP